ncbi:MAG: ABC transporter ATP-binding protein [Trueperaceae bacterium]|nr:MAG: ABC transporter ATP-binding protein [Trueperaceae bacterium]
MAHAVTVDQLTKRFGSVTAAAGVSFTIESGAIFGIVGPNGAGKTTILECIEGLRRPDAGRVRVLGLDPWRDRFELRERIGVQLQTAALPERIRVGEAVALFADLYRRRGDPAAALRRVGLDDRRDATVAHLSGGQRQRLFIALALVHEPDVVFLDELTTGLDPQARRDAWALVRDIRARGATVVLTTHFMEEAERLCDRVAIVDRGRVVALDSVGRLIASLGEERRVAFTHLGVIDEAAVLSRPGVVRVERIGDRVVVSVRGTGTAGRVTTALEESGVAFDDLRVERPTLEDVFLARTGMPLAGAPLAGAPLAYAVEPEV